MFTDSLDEDDDVDKKQLNIPTEDPDKELHDSRRATLGSPERFGFFRNDGKQH